MFDLTSPKCFGSLLKQGGCLWRDRQQDAASHSLSVQRLRLPQFSPVWQAAHRSHQGPGTSEFRIDNEREGGEGGRRERMKEGECGSLIRPRAQE